MPSNSLGAEEHRWILSRFTREKTFHCRLGKKKKCTTVKFHEGSSELKVPSFDSVTLHTVKSSLHTNPSPPSLRFPPAPPVSHILLTTSQLTLLICGLASGKTVYLLSTVELTVWNISKGDFLRNRAMEGRLGIAEADTTETTFPWTWNVTTTL